MFGRKNFNDPITSVFVSLIEENLRKHREVSYYADLLKVTINHLNYSGKKYLSIQASWRIYDGIITEAQNTLVQTI